MKMKEDLVLIEVFFFYKDQTYLTYECKLGSFGLVLLPTIYQNGNQLVFTIIQVILI